MKTCMFIFSLALLLSCKNNVRHKDYGKDPALYSKKFVLVELNGTLIKTKGSPVHLTFLEQDNVTTGSGGCNSFTGMWSTRKEFLKMTILNMTDMVCTEGMETEAAFTKMLKEVDRFELSSDKNRSTKIKILRLYVGDKRVAVMNQVLEP
jgi:heat shock protein HslJ